MFRHWKNYLLKKRSRFRHLEGSLLSRMAVWGHFLERILLGILFFWFGLLKITDNPSASSLIAKSVYWFDPQFIVPVLGYWEVLMGLSLFSRRLLRFAILLFVIRLPGTFLALYYHYDECFSGSIFLPTIQGQYLLKEIALVGAALVITESIRRKKTS